MDNTKRDIFKSHPLSIDSVMVDLHGIYEILNKIDQTAVIVSNTGEIIYANDDFLNTFNLTVEHLHDNRLYDPVLGITTKEQFDRVIEDTRTNGGKLKVDRRIIRGDHTRYTEVTVIEYKMFGHERFFFLSKDVTESKISRLQADELNQMLKKIIDNLPVYLFVKDVDNDLRYLIWNDAFASYSKIPAEKVIGRTDFEVFPDYRDAQAFRDDDMRVVETGEMTQKHETYMAADGTTRAVQTYKTLVQRKGRGPLLVGISLDITDIEGIEQELIDARLRAEESDRLKTRFLANMSHEIRTPLNAIVGFSGMLSDADDEETRQTFTQIISENSELLLQLINDILDLSKIEAGMLEYTRMPMDLQDSCRNLVFIYQDKLHPGVKLIFDNEDRTDELIINEDRNRLIQVMDNLLNNAAKFTVEGEIHYGYKMNDDHIEVYVSDTGRGIPKEKQEEVFERFVKLDNFVQGTGLGLSICKLIVETLGGTMKLVSEEGKGSTFSFTIPYHEDKHVVSADRTEQQSAQTMAHRSGKSDQTILVAEDVNSNFLVVKTMIQGRYNILWAKDGHEAVAMARDKKPDLILMDIKMPNMNGLEAAAEIRKFDREVPIVALTANAFDEDRTISKQAGMNNFLTKPINRDAFEAILTAYLSPLDLS